MAADRSSRRRRFDDSDWESDSQHNHHHEHHRTDPTNATSQDGSVTSADEPLWSTYRDARRGPGPIPAWLVINPLAIDADRGVVKTGKEADVSLVERAVDGGESCLLAAKRYRSAEHRMFHRDAGYLEGRRLRRTREMRAMSTRTTFGRDLIAQQWAVAEFNMLSRLWELGVAVPYPVQLLGTEVMMEFIGDPDGTAAPRLAELRPDRATSAALYKQLLTALRQLTEAGYVHGDLSPYNVLAHHDRLVLIDLSQAIDLVGNPQGFEYLRRDCTNIATWLAGHGVPWAAPDDLFHDVTAGSGGGGQLLFDFGL